MNLSTKLPSSGRTPLLLLPFSNSPHLYIPLVLHLPITYSSQQTVRYNIISPQNRLSRSISSYQAGNIHRIFTSLPSNADHYHHCSAQALLTLTITLCFGYSATFLLSFHRSIMIYIPVGSSFEYSYLW